MNVYCIHLGRSFPMMDATLAKLDALLGFDWTAYLLLIDRHPFLNDWVLRPAYMSIFWQPGAIAVVLVALGRSRDALALTAAMILGVMACSTVATLMPAYGAYHQMGITAAMHPHLTDLVTLDSAAATLDWLRLDNPVGIMPAYKNGLISFPSFHATCAVLCTWAAWSVRPLRYGALALNTAMLVATPVHGSHYLVDVIAGALIAVALMSLVTAAQNALEARSRTERALPTIRRWPVLRT